ncbi:MAG: EFR1 family ferrodoxin [Oscillospiraceae bacterium]|nr:EFR1 family ferrodoxin [Oscillospiraceae bacterium]
MAAIFCFSSTGNSLYTANEIAKKIGADVLPMKNKPAACEDDVIGFVFPVYFWGLPRMVERFISAMQITNKDAYVFAVITCGGPVPGIFGPLKKILRRKNIRLRYGERLISVTNYLPEYTPKDSEALRQNIKAQIHRIAGAIIRRDENRIPALPLVNRLISKLCPDANSDRYFSVATTCKSCATCQKACPAGNIEMSAGSPVFLHKCEHCLACLHHCPARAIDWKDKTQGKKRYRNAYVSLDELIAFNTSLE